jgi:hypothetical protein
MAWQPNDFRAPKVSPTATEAIILAFPVRMMGEKISKSHEVMMMGR